jgi:hypothetical protein
VSLEDAQRILDELGGRMDTTEIRHPIRYCSELVRRFQHGEFEPRLGPAIADRRRAERQRELQRQSRETKWERTSNALPSHLRTALERMRIRARHTSRDDNQHCNETVGKKMPQDESDDKT